MFYEINQLIFIFKNQNCYCKETLAQLSTLKGPRAKKNCGSDCKGDSKWKCGGIDNKHYNSLYVSRYMIKIQGKSD